MTIKKGNKYMRVAMVSVARSAVRTKNSYWEALFEHLRKRMKAQKAIIAIARRMLKVIYKVIDQKIKYHKKKGSIIFWTCKEEGWKRSYHLDFRKMTT